MIFKSQEFFGPISQSSNIGRAYFVSRGIGHRGIKIIIEAGNVKCTSTIGRPFGVTTESQSASNRIVIALRMNYNK